MPDILQELEDKIAANKRELAEQEHALEVLKRMMGKIDSPPLVANAPKNNTAEVEFGDLFSGDGLTKRRSFVDDVRGLVLQFGENEFTVAIVEAALKKIDIVIDAKQPRARIAHALGRLVNEGALQLVFKGAGNQPSIYKVKAEEKKEDNDISEFL